MFTRLRLDALLERLAAKITKNTATLAEYRRLHSPGHRPRRRRKTNRLSLRSYGDKFSALLAANTDLVMETGDSWFNGQKLHLPDGAGYHFQMQYGSIGWATGAALGVSLGGGRETSHCRADWRWLVSAHGARSLDDDPSPSKSRSFSCSTTAATRSRSKSTTGRTITSRTGTTRA